MPPAPDYAPLVPAIDSDLATGTPGNLVTRIARGDATAEAEFVRDYGPGVRALVRRHTRAGDPNVDDYCQDVLANVLLALRRGDLREATALGGYVRNAVIYTVQGEYRRRQRRGEEGVQEDAEVAAATDDPVREAQRTQLGRAVTRVLAELPVARDRELLQRFYVDEEDAETVCKALGIDPGHFRRVAHRARERLRALLERAGFGEAP